MNKIVIYTILALFFINTPVFAQDTNEKKNNYFKKAEHYFFQKKFEMAEIMLQNEIKNNPENEKAYSYLGDIFLHKKRFDAALIMYQKALELNTNNADNYFRIGQVYYYKKLPDLSISNYKVALNLDKTLKFSYYHIGLTYLMLKRDKQNTITHWEAYLRVAPEDPQYEKIRRAIELLKDPNFQLPPPGSDISIEEALLLGGQTLTKVDRDAQDKKAGHEKMKSNKKFKGLILDDDDL